MKRSLAFMVGLVALAGFAWSLGLFRGWTGSLAGLLPSSPAPVAPSASSTVPGPVFAGDRTHAYLVGFSAGEGANAVDWQVTVDGRASGFAYTANEAYGAYGEVVTSTDQLILTAYRPTGEIVATATATWMGTAATGTMRYGARTYPLRLAEAATSSAALSFEEAEGGWADEARSMSCDFSLTYPVVRAGGPVSRAAAERINAEIRRSFLAPVMFAWEEYRRGGPQTAEQVKEDYLRACRNQLEQEAADFGPSEGAGGMFRRSELTSVAVSSNRDGYLSFTADRSTYSGGAHGSVLREGFVFDLATGQRLEIDDVIRADARHLFGQRLASDLLRDYRDDLFEDSATRLRAFVASAPARAKVRWEANESGLSTSTTFYLVPTGLRVVFQQYEVTPYAVGIPEITLPYARWRDLVMPGRAWPF